MLDNVGVYGRTVFPVLVVYVNGLVDGHSFVSIEVLFVTKSRTVKSF